MNMPAVFTFESNSIRIVTIGDEPWFVGKDVCQSLGYSDHTSAMKQHCKGVVKLHPLKTSGGTQEVRVLSESDVLRLIVRSHLPSAEAFERLVFEEILPAIRKTGSYSAPGAKEKPSRRTTPDPVLTQNRQAKAVLSTYMYAGKLLGTETAMARAIAVSAVKDIVGIDFAPLLIGNAVEEKPMTPTELGSLMGYTAKEVNAMLLIHGLQIKDKTGSWMPTDKGKEFCTVNPYKSQNSEHTGYRVLWRRGVIDVLNEGKI